MAETVYTVRCVGCGAGGDHSVDLSKATDAGSVMAAIADLIADGHIVVIGPRDRLDDDLFDADTGNPMVIIDPDMIHSNWKELN